MKSVATRSDLIENFRLYMISEFIQGICELHSMYCGDSKNPDLQFRDVLMEYGVLYDSNMDFDILKSNTKELNNGAYTYSDREVIIYDDMQDARIYIDFDTLMKRYALCDMLNRLKHMEV